MTKLNIALSVSCGTHLVALAWLLRPHWFARFVSEAFLIRHSLWDECDGEPMNVWAEEFVRRDQPKDPA